MVLFLKDFIHIRVNQKKCVHKATVVLDDDTLNMVGNTVETFTRKNKLTLK